MGTAPVATPTARYPMILTVEVEDCHHVAASEGVIPRFERRLQSNTRRALDLLAATGITATFFVRGWIAAAMPELLREIAGAGHELASKGDLPVAGSAARPAELLDDVARAQEAIESATGRAVRGHRFVRQWWRPVPFWARRALATRGYAYDSSFLPVFAPLDLDLCARFAHSHLIAGREYWELPMPAVSPVGCLLPIPGGNCVRPFPHRLVKRVVDRWHRTRSGPFVMHFRVGELDPTRPHISSAARLTRRRHDRRLDRLEPILEDYLRTYRFESAAQHLALPGADRVTPSRAATALAAPPVPHPRRAPRDVVAGPTVAGVPSASVPAPDGARGRAAPA